MRILAVCLWWDRPLLIFSKLGSLKYSCTHKLWIYTYAKPPTNRIILLLMTIETVSLQTYWEPTSIMLSCTGLVTHHQSTEHVVKLIIGPHLDPGVLCTNSSGELEIRANWRFLDSLCGLSKKHILNLSIYHQPLVSDWFCFFNICRFSLLIPLHVIHFLMIPLTG